MRCIIQRVTSASVTVDSQLVLSIEEGLLLLIGITLEDSTEDVEYIARKVLSLKLFPSDKTEWGKSVLRSGKEIMAVSQFTLFARTSKGTKPDFHRASNASHSKPIFDMVVAKLRDQMGERVKEGVFGENMKVMLVNDGPVTVIIDSKIKDY